MSPKENQEIVVRQEEDEDWRVLTNANERRRVQNRIAQRNYRRNIKRRLQQLELFKGGLLESSSTPKDKQQSYPTPPKDSTPPKRARRDSVVPAAPNGKLPSLEQINAPVTGPSDQPSVQPFLLNSTEETEHLLSMPSQENGNVGRPQKTETTTMFDLATPLTDAENDILMFAQSTASSSASNCSLQSTLSFSLNALQKAVVKGRYDIAKLLVEHGADVYILDDYGNNILHLAAEFGHPSLVSFALLHCVNVNGVNAAGETPLHVAIEHDFVEIVDMLIKAGADMDFKS